MITLNLHGIRIDKPDLTANRLALRIFCTVENGSEVYEAESEEDERGKQTNRARPWFACSIFGSSIHRLSAKQTMVNANHDLVGCLH